MGVDISTYRAQIGTFVNFSELKSVRHSVIYNENYCCAKFHFGFAVFFVSLMLIFDVELNPGPTRKHCTASDIYQALLIVTRSFQMIIG